MANGGVADRGVPTTVRYAQSKYPVEVDRLIALGRRGGMGTREIARATGLPKSTVHERLAKIRQLEAARDGD